MGDWSDYQRRQIVGARLAGASLTKRTTLFDVSREAFPKFMTAYIFHAKTSSAKRNSARKQTRSKRECRTLENIVPKTTELLQQRCQQNSMLILETLFPQNCPKRASQI